MLYISISLLANYFFSTLQGIVITILFLYANLTYFREIFNTSVILCCIIFKVLIRLYCKEKYYPESIIILAILYNIKISLILKEMVVTKIMTEENKMVQYSDNSLSFLLSPFS